MISFDAFLEGLGNLSSEPEKELMQIARIAVKNYSKDTTKFFSHLAQKDHQIRELWQEYQKKARGVVKKDDFSPQDPEVVARHDADHAGSEENV